MPLPTSTAWGTGRQLTCQRWGLECWGGMSPGCRVLSVPVSGSHKGRTGKEGGGESVNLGYTTRNSLYCQNWLKNTMEEPCTLL